MQIFPCLDEVEKLFGYMDIMEYRKVKLVGLRLKAGVERHHGGSN